jgi:hypothetical protein
MFLSVLNFENILSTIWLPEAINHSIKSNDRYVDNFDGCVSVGMGETKWTSPAE